jgi:hypothetical protein
MYEVISGERDVSRVAVDTFKRQVAVGDGILEVEAGTNGYGPASRTYLRLQDIMGTDMNVAETHDSEGNVDGFVLKLAGGSELTAIINALNFMVKVLDEQRREVVG